jgi:hypothetical protein
MGKWFSGQRAREQVIGLGFKRLNINGSPMNRALLQARPGSVDERRLSISVPKLRTGVQRLSDTPGLALDHIGDVYSSDSRSSYSARSEVPETRLEVTLTRGGTTGIVEREFSAGTSSSPAGALKVTKGRLYLRLADSKDQRGT